MPRRAPRNIYKLDFTDTPYGQADEDGDPLEIEMTGLSMGESLDAADMEQAFREAGNDSVKAARITRDMMATLAPHLVRWNLVDDTGAEIAANLHGLLAQDPLFTFDIIRAYRTAVIGVTENLPPRSSDGDKSVEQSLPMETSSANPPLSPAPNSFSDVSNDSAVTPSTPS